MEVLKKDMQVDSQWNNSSANTFFFFLCHLFLFLFCFFYGSHPLPSLIMYFISDNGPLMPSTQRRVISEKFLDIA